MQILFKTAYEDDVRFLAKTGEKIRVGLVIAFLLAAPLFLQNYYLAELGLLLVYTYVLLKKQFHGIKKSTVLTPGT